MKLALLAACPPSSPFLRAARGIVPLILSYTVYGGRNTYMILVPST